MKKYVMLILVVVSCLVMFTGCAGDDGYADSADADLDGIWRFGGFPDPPAAAGKKAGQDLCEGQGPPGADL